MTDSGSQFGVQNITPSLSVDIFWIVIIETRNRLHSKTVRGGWDGRKWQPVLSPEYYTFTFHGILWYVINETFNSLHDKTARGG